MATEVLLNPPHHLLPHWEQITEGWNAFFDNKDSKDNPYLTGTPKHSAWRWGFFEGMDYGQ